MSLRGLGFLENAEWEGQATHSGTEEHDGESCVVITLEIETSGELPEMGFGGGRRGGRQLEPAAFGGRLVVNTFDVELEGRLLFSTSSGHPVLLELGGDVETERGGEFEREGRTMSFNSTSSGTFSHTVTLTRE